MKSKYGTFPEYHTSLDKLGSVVTPKGLYDGFNLVILFKKSLDGKYNIMPVNKSNKSISLSKLELIKKNRVKLKANIVPLV